jgi:hypothetical protein
MQPRTTQDNNSESIAIVVVDMIGSFRTLLMDQHIAQYNCYFAVLTNA